MANVIRGTEQNKKPDREWFLEMDGKDIDVCFRVAHVPDRTRAFSIMENGLVFKYDCVPGDTADPPLIVNDKSQIIVQD